MAIVSHFPGGGSGGGGAGGSDKPLWEIIDFEGSSQHIDDGDGNWRVKFLSSGTFTPSEDIYVDIFAVGGGGNGGTASGGRSYGGGGGGGGYTNTSRTVKLSRGTKYTVEVGSACGTSSLSNDAGDILCEAAGGISGNGSDGGNGGSGGGNGYKNGAAVGSPGSDGENGSTAISGIGQGSTTREFGEPNGDLYSGGGGGAGDDWGSPCSSGGAGGGGTGATKTTAAGSGAINTGGGGGGASYAIPTFGEGGSGIVIIRNMRVEAS